MKRKRLVLTVCLTAALIAAALFPRASADAMYFFVVNGTICDFGSWNQPMLFENTMMIPLKPLTDAGNKLGLHYQWQAEDQLLTLYSGGKQLTFDKGLSAAFSGDERYAAPMIRFERDIFYVPVGLICEIFDGLEWGQKTTDWGIMVRVHNTEGQLTNDQFAKHRAPLIKDAYETYIKSFTPTPVPSPSPGAPSPSAPPLQPSPLLPPEPENEPVPVYLTFDGGVTGATPVLLDFLEEQSLPALFFLPSETLFDDLAQVRRIAARHQIGLLLDGTDGEVLFSAAREGNERLREAALVKTWLLRSDNAPSEPSGYRFWGYTLRFSETDTAEDIVTLTAPLLVKTPNPSAVVLSLPHTDAALKALTVLAQSFIENDAAPRRVSPGMPAA